MQLNRPVKWIEGRRENMQATIHGRGQTGYIEIGVKKDGTITGLRYNVFADMGAYFQLLTPAIPTLTGLMLSGCLQNSRDSDERDRRVHQQDVDGRVSRRGTPRSDLCGRARMDLTAAELGMDPVEVRRKNFPSRTSSLSRPRPAFLRQRELPGRAR